MLLLKYSNSIILSRCIKNSFAQIKRRNYSNKDPIYNVFDALKFTQVHAVANFDETLDINLILNVDPKRGDHLVRGSCALPAGLGKLIRVAVHAEPHMHEKAIAAGADIIANEDFFNQIKKYTFNFDKFLCTHGCIAEVKQFAKILGPRGLMPNPKTGTLVAESLLEETIRNAKFGFVEFRVDSGSGLNAPLGKASFSSEKILRNLKAFMEAVSEKKPEKIKGKYILAAFLSTTMGPSFRIDPQSLDPKDKSYALVGY